MIISLVLVKLTVMSLLIHQSSTCWKKYCMLDDSVRPCSTSVNVVSSEAGVKCEVVKCEVRCEVGCDWSVASLAGHLALYRTVIKLHQRRRLS